MKKVSFLFTACLIISSTHTAEFDKSLFDVFEALPTQKKIFFCVTPFLVPFTVMTADYIKESIEKKEMQDVNVHKLLGKHFNYDNLHLVSLNTLFLLATWGGLMAPLIYLRHKSFTFKSTSSQYRPGLNSLTRLH